MRVNILEWRFGSSNCLHSNIHLGINSSCDTGKNIPSDIFNVLIKLALLTRCFTTTLIKRWSGVTTSNQSNQSVMLQTVPEHREYFWSAEVREFRAYERWSGKDMCMLFFVVFLCYSIPLDLSLITGVTAGLHTSLDRFKRFVFLSWFT